MWLLQCGRNKSSLQGLLWGPLATEWLDLTTSVFCLTLMCTSLLSKLVLIESKWTEKINWKHCSLSQLVFVTFLSGHFLFVWNLLFNNFPLYPINNFECPLATTECPSMRYHSWSRASQILSLTLNITEAIFRLLWCAPIQALPKKATTANWWLAITLCGLINTHTLTRTHTVQSWRSAKLSWPSHLQWRQASAGNVVCVTGISFSGCLSACLPACCLTVCVCVWLLIAW